MALWLHIVIDNAVRYIHVLYPGSTAKKIKKGSGIALRYICTECNYSCWFYRCSGIGWDGGIIHQVLTGRGCMHVPALMDCV